MLERYRGGNVKAGYIRADGAQNAIAAAVAALEAAGCSQVIVESGPRGAAGPSPAFDALVSRLQEGDELVAVDLEHVAGGLPQLLERLTGLLDQGIQMRTLSGEINTVDGDPGDLIAALHAFNIKMQNARVALHQVSPSHGPGRPRRLRSDEILTARRLIETGGRPVRDVARELGVSRATLYRSLRSN